MLPGSTPAVYDIPESGPFGSMMRIELPAGASTAKFTVEYRYEWMGWRCMHR